MNPVQKLDHAEVKVQDAKTDVRDEEARKKLTKARHLLVEAKEEIRD